MLNLMGLQKVKPKHLEIGLVILMVIPMDSHLDLHSVILMVTQMQMATVTDLRLAKPMVTPMVKQKHLEIAKGLRMG